MQLGLGLKVAVARYKGRWERDGFLEENLEGGESRVLVQRY